MHIDFTGDFTLPALVTTKQLLLLYKDSAFYRILFLANHTRQSSHTASWHTHGAYCF